MGGYADGIRVALGRDFPTRYLPTRRVTESGSDTNGENATGLPVLSGTNPG
jgi:hypothetical protein